MRKSHLNMLACPNCQSDISIKTIDDMDNDRIVSGELHCTKCNVVYPIKNYIPRFVPEENYADNFGFQWNRYTEAQYDSKLELPMSESRFYKTTNWPKQMVDKVILEAGCGAGRFTEIVLDTGATVISFDYSNAVEANYKMNGKSSNLLVVQGDIFSPPVKKKNFDYVYCMGVLQHTPDPEKAFSTLSQFVKKGGNIVIDVYIKEGIWEWLTSYRRLHWITRHMNVRHVHTLSKVYVDLVWPISKWLWRFGRTGRRIARYVFLTKDRFWRKGLDVSDEVQKESLVLHFIDQLCAYHDHPQSIETVRRWFSEQKIDNAEVFKGGNGVIGRGQV